MEGVWAYDATKCQPFPSGTTLLAMRLSDPLTGTDLTNDKAKDGRKPVNASDRLACPASRGVL